MAELAFHGVGKLFAGSVRALDDVSFTVRDHEIVALCGPSSCGKTTALRIAMGLEASSEGQVTVDGKPIAGCGHDRGIVFQHAELLVVGQFELT